MREREKEKRVRKKKDKEQKRDTMTVVCMYLYILVKGACEDNMLTLVDMHITIHVNILFTIHRHITNYNYHKTRDVTLSMTMTLFIVYEIRILFT